MADLPVMISPIGDGGQYGEEVDGELNAATASDEEIFAWKKSRRQTRELFFVNMRAASLNEFRALTQVIMDEWDRLVDTTTASAVVISNTLNDIIDGVEFSAGFGILFTTFLWVFIIIIFVFVTVIIFCLHQFSKSDVRRKALGKVKKFRKKIISRKKTFDYI